MNRHTPEQLNTPAVSEEYSLEEIMREFGTPRPSEHEPTAPAVKEDPAEPVKEDEPAIRIHKPSDAPKPKKRISDDTMVFEPIHVAPAEPNLEAPMKIASDGKLPTAKRSPIVDEKLPKRSRKERKAERERKLLGEIKECAPLSAQEQLKSCRKGLGTQRLRGLLLALPVLSEFFLLLYDANGWTFLPFVQTMGFALPLMLLCASIAFAYDIFLTAAKDLLRFRITLHTLTAVATVLTLIQTLLQRNGLPQTYCAIASLLLFSQLQALHCEKAAQFHTLRTICAFEAPMGIYDTPKLLENTDSLRRDDGNAADFLEKLETKNTPQKLLRIYATVLFVMLPALAYLLSVTQNASFLTAWLLLSFGAIPCGAAASFVRPFASTAKRLSGYHGALCGWHGAKVFGGKHTIVLSDEDLFPQKNITSNGMKLYGEYKASRTIAYALAALKLVDSPLSALFQSLLDSQYGKQFPVTQHRIYEDGGIGAEIAGDIVLVGSLSFMRSMGVHMPAGTRVRQAVYVSIGGELAGIFAVKYKPSTSTKAGLRDILANHNFSVILATRDFLISPELIAAKYELPTDTMRYPDYSERLRLSEASPEERAHQGALIAKDTFGAFAVTVAAGRTLRLSTLAALWLNFFAGFLGLLLCALLLAWNAVEVASPLHIVSFQLLWAFLSSFVSIIIRKF